MKKIKRLFTENFHTISAVIVVIYGLINIISAIFPPLPIRFQILREFLPLYFVLGAQTLTVLLGLMLIVLSDGLENRRKRALYGSIILLVLSSIFHIIKGLDIEEAILNVLFAILLVYKRKSFFIVSRKPLVKKTLQRFLRDIGLYYAYIIMGFFILKKYIFPDLTPIHMILEPINLLLDQPYYHYFKHQGIWFEHSIVIIGALWMIFMLVRLIRPFVLLESEDLGQKHVKALIKKYAKDTLSYFSLQNGREYFFNDDNDTFISYKLWEHIAVVGGDPVGPEEKIPFLLKKFISELKASGVKPCFVAVSDKYVSIYKKLRYIPLKIGEEAIIDIKNFDSSLLSKKVRRAVRFIENQNIKIKIYKRADLPQTYCDEMKKINDQWLRKRGGREYGFSMTLGRFPEEKDGDCDCVLALHGRTIVGYLIMVPIPLLRAWSLDAMRRKAHAPNGLMEFLIIRMTEVYKKREENLISLNFATFADSKNEIKSRVIRRIQKGVFRYFSVLYQSKSLYIFNNKFHPYWQSRYIMFPDKRSFPTVAIAILYCEKFVYVSAVAKTRNFLGKIFISS